MDKKQKKRDEENARPEASQAAEGLRRSRASDTLIRIVSDNHTKLSGMADTKAHIILTLCAGIITVSVTGILRPPGDLHLASIVTWRLPC